MRIRAHAHDIGRYDGQNAVVVIGIKRDYLCKPRTYRKTGMDLIVKDPCRPILFKINLYQEHI